MTAQATIDYSAQCYNIACNVCYKLIIIVSQVGIASSNSIASTIRRNR